MILNTEFEDGSAVYTRQCIVYQIEVFLEPSALGLYSSWEDLALKATQILLDTRSSNALLHMVPRKNKTSYKHEQKLILN